MLKDPYIVKTIISQMAVRVSASCTGPTLLHRNIFISASDTHFCLRLSKPQRLVQLERLGKLIKAIHLIESQALDLPACSIVL
jgi:hypothetical protein